MEAVVLSYFLLWPALGYVLGFAGMIIEGDVAIFIVGFLSQLGFFNPWIMYLALFAGAIAGDSLWYVLGLHFHKLPAFLNRWVEHIAPPFDDHLINRTFHTIFISKFTYGLHHAFFVRAGMLGLPLKRFLRVDVPASALWLLIIGGLGYASAASTVYLRGYVKFAEILLLAAVVLFITLQHYLAKYSKRRL